MFRFQNENFPQIYTNLFYVVMITTIKAYYDGTSFVPVNHLEIPVGKIFLLSVLQEESQPNDISNKLAAFRQITDILQTLNDTEPLPSEFDNILSQQIHFKTEINL